MVRPYPLTLVDDEASDAQLVELVWRELCPDGSFTWFETGDALLEAMEGGQRVEGVLLVDLRMPGMSGVDVIAWVQEHPGFGKPLCLAYSSSDQPRDVSQAYGAGAHLYLTKPLGLDRLRQLIGTVHELAGELVRLPADGR